MESKKFKSKKWGLYKIKVEILNPAPEERPVKPTNMADTYTQLYIHIVFAVKGRQNLISKHNREELHKYISGIVEKRTQKLLAIFCMPDHLHLLVSVKPNVSISDLVRDIKAGSSNFINSKKWIKGKFNWQQGFGAFSCSKSHAENVIDYILNQEQHHTRTKFKDEYLQFLKEYSIEYKEEYLFDFMEQR